MPHIAAKGVLSDREPVLRYLEKWRTRSKAKHDETSPGWYNVGMPSVTPDEVHAYLAGLALANQFEIEELRKAPVELKLRQIWTLMTSADLLEDAAQRDIDVQEVRKRWDRLYYALL